MPTATLVHQGDRIDYTPAPGSDVAVGAVVVQGDLIGIANRPIPANTLGALEVTGVFDVPKATGASTAIAAGVKVYWDVADQQAKADSETGANKYLGKTVLAAVDADTTVRVRLEQ